MKSTNKLMNKVMNALIWIFLHFPLINTVQYYKNKGIWGKSVLILYSVCTCLKKRALLVLRESYVHYNFVPKPFQIYLCLLHIKALKNAWHPILRYSVIQKDRERKGKSIFCGCIRDQNKTTPKKRASSSAVYSFFKVWCHSRSYFYFFCIFLTRHILIQPLSYVAPCTELRCTSAIDSFFGKDIISKTVQFCFLLEK